MSRIYSEEEKIRIFRGIPLVNRQKIFTMVRRVAKRNKKL